MKTTAEITVVVTVSAVGKLLRWPVINRVTVHPLSE